MTKQATDCAWGSGAESTRRPFGSSCRWKTATGSMVEESGGVRRRGRAGPLVAPRERPEQALDLVGGVRVHDADPQGAVGEAEVVHHLDRVGAPGPDREPRRAQAGLHLLGPVVRD